MTSACHFSGPRRVASQVQHEPSESTDFCSSLLRMLSPPKCSALDRNSLDSQQIISRSRQVILNNLTARAVDNPKDLSCLSARKNIRQVHFQHRLSHGRGRAKRRPEYVITEHSRDQDEEKEYILDYMSAYKQLDSNLEEASTLAAKSDIDLNRAREGTDTRLSTIHACGERTEPSGAENSLKTVMREAVSYTHLTLPTICSV
eukprot:TRINITY_DN6918_c0_g2_i3.p1 TRINITY_DN6918_c0_g2~~TRINITY_DN6918_c0_g2_i3.p1  ORF type:complete len:203 (+),score=24.54 TRINITY_DN6918_c0_g2_i3:122-730(+)